jgi:hypothetical protein
VDHLERQMEELVAQMRAVVTNLEVIAKSMGGLRPSDRERTDLDTDKGWSVMDWNQGSAALGGAAREPIKDGDNRIPGARPEEQGDYIAKYLSERK